MEVDPPHPPPVTPPTELAAIKLNMEPNWDRDSGEAEDAVSIMTLHGAKGLEYETVFLPGWEEGLFPSQRSMDEGGRAGLEETFAVLRFDHAGRDLEKR